jgi:hypothetical protein
LSTHGRYARPFGKEVINRTLATQIPEFYCGIEVRFPVRFHWFDAALLSAAAFFSFALIAALTLAPKNGTGGVAVIFAPWTEAADALARSAGAGGRFVRFGAFDFISIVEPEASTYAQRARASGAWFVADPAALAACLKPFARNKS